MTAEYPRFSPMQKEQLDQGGAFILASNGETIGGLERNNKKIWTRQQEDSPTLMSFRSLRSEIAIFPNRLYIPNSNNKTVQEQEAMVAEFEQEMRQKQSLEKVKVVLGNTPTHAVVAFSYRAETGERLHGRVYSYAYARTKNPTRIKPHIVDVGFFSDDNRLGLNYYPEEKDYFVFASPLLLPK